MAGCILFLQTREGAKEPLATVPNLSAYECQTQIQAMEQQASAMGKMLVITATLADWPEEDEPAEEVKSDE